MNVEQVRAQLAFTFVQTLARQDAGTRSAFLNLARSLPVMLQTNGLLAAWAHLLAKGAKRKEYKEMARAILEHLRGRGLAPATGDAQDALTDWWAPPASGATGRDLRQTTAEAVAYSVWLKRAAEALLETGESGAGSVSAENASVTP
jgi:CRISPR/Cas system CMR-associated protein Cmr5 small subunit